MYYDWPRRIPDVIKNKCLARFINATAMVYLRQDTWSVYNCTTYNNQTMLMKISEISNQTLLEPHPDLLHEIPSYRRSSSLPSTTDNDNILLSNYSLCMLSIVETEECDMSLGRFTNMLLYRKGLKQQKNGILLLTWNEKINVRRTMGTSQPTLQSISLSFLHISLNQPAELRIRITDARLKANVTMSSTWRWSIQLFFSFLFVLLWMTMIYFSRCFRRNHGEEEEKRRISSTSEEIRIEGKERRWRSVKSEERQQQ